MKINKRISLVEFNKRFSCEDDCRSFLFQKKFPSGFTCPKCGCKEFYSVKSRNKYQCKNCNHQTSLTTQTVMNRTHIPLLKWFWTIFLVSTDKRGYSALQLSKELGLPYKTAWYLLLRVRKSMADRDDNYMLSGIIEFDDTYFGSKTKGGKRGRGTEKTNVIVTLSKTDKGKLQYLKMKVTPNLKGKTLSVFTQSNIEKAAVIQSDAFPSYRKPLSENNNHEYKVYDPADTWLLKLHMMIGNVKAYINGTFHGVGKYLQLYLDEFCYRFNRKGFGENIFERLVIAVANSSPFVFSA